MSRRPSGYDRSGREDDAVLGAVWRESGARRLLHTREVANAQRAVRVSGNFIRDTDVLRDRRRRAGMRFRVMAQMRALVRDLSIRGGPEASTAATPKRKRLNYLQMAGEV